jgi:hypothetical protein
LCRHAARRSFERETGLTDVGCARPDSYLTLRHAIQHYAQAEQLSDLRVAANRWYVSVFRPLWQATRARELTGAFPGDRTADVIARLVAWRQVEAANLDWHAALDRFALATLEP